MMKKRAIYKYYLSFLFMQVFYPLREELKTMAPPSLIKRADY
jgi:hypothetical protein